MGSMIGSGVFIVSADIARQVGGGLWVLVVWAVAGLMTVLGAASYGELASLFPAAGGQYVYLREAFGRAPAFLYGWTLFLVIQTGTLAAVAVAFAKFLGVLVPAISASEYVLYLPDLPGGVAIGVTTQQAVAVAVLAALTANNSFGLSAGKAVQNVFTVLKVATLLGVTALGLAHASDAGALRASDFAAAFRADGPISASGLPVAIAVALVGALFSADAWNNVTFAAGEVRAPERTVPRALVLGTVVVVTLYLVTNVAYLNVLAQPEVAAAPDDRVATALMRAVLGPPGAAVMAALVMVSTFGCLNGMVLAGPRLYYAMAADGLFLSAAGRLSPRTRVPTWGLWVQGAWAAVLALSGTYGDLLDYVIFAALLFYAVSVAGVFRLRRTRPDLPRHYSAPGYPVLPALYVAACVFVMGVLLVEKPGYTWPGLGIVAAGVPVYLLVRRRRAAPEEPA
ncbi:MAG: amino acid permease [Deltaproteobacteria bacterium]|nr:amino acid permease [Deltaproteobacteria bacterium]